MEGRGRGKGGGGGLIERGGLINFLPLKKGGLIEDLRYITHCTQYLSSLWLIKSLRAILEIRATYGFMLILDGQEYKWNTNAISYS